MGSYNSKAPLLVVALALSDCDGRWLMQRRPQHKRHGGLWEFPGGKIEEGETSRLALAREIKEEIDIIVKPEHLEPCGFAETAERDDADWAGEEAEPSILLLLFRASKWSGQPQPMEGGKLGWFHPKDILELDKPLLDCKLARRLFG